jgi:hypothetical protein
MDKNTIFDAFGYVLKEEGFIKLTSKIIPGTLVVENQMPFPGYHGENLPHPETAPGDIYFITKKAYLWEEITSISNKIKKYIGFHFLYYDAQIQMDTNVFTTIRVRGLKTYEQLEELQKAYLAEGILFEKDRKFGDLGLTKLKKFFILKVIDEHIFHDQELEHTYYFVIPHLLSWEFFRKMTNLTRSNLIDYNFDAAQAVVYYRNEMHYTIRVYGCNCSLEKAQLLREKYLELINKYE